MGEIRRSRITVFGFLLLAGLTLAGCGAAGAEEIPPSAAATIAALTAENQRLQEEIDALQAPVSPGASDHEGGFLGEMLAAGEGEPTDAAGEEPPAEPTAPPATPTPSATPLPPPTPLPTYVPAALTGEPPADRYLPATRFAAAWQADPERSQAVGWALEPEAASVAVVTQPFERGVMIWRSDTEQIYALWNRDGVQQWRAFTDTFQEGEPERDPALAAPSGFRQPERGFGKIWRQNPELREALGWGLLREAQDEAQIQAFERGLMISRGAQVYVIGQTPEGETIWYQE
jgi:hypothetical protein